MLETLQRETRAEIVIRRETGARNIRVFGSVVRGDNRAESDVDLLVDNKDQQTPKGSPSLASISTLPR
jgi:predicted nucleotidyltransferase